MLADYILNYYCELSKTAPTIPSGFRIINPYCGDNKEKITAIMTAFYKKYYDDTSPRFLILGSSPARRGTAVTGIPFEDAAHLQQETGIFIDNYYVNKASSSFLFDVMEQYGSCEKFYSNFYMNFVCPLGIVRTKPDGKEVNCNYYENKKLQDALEPFMLKSIRALIGFGINTSVCYCIGSGENYNYLSKINQRYHFFEKIIPLEHPRFIMQYNSSRKDYFLDKYIAALTHPSASNTDIGSV